MICIPNYSHIGVFMLGSKST